MNMSADVEHLKKIADRLRVDVIEMTSEAGSGHPGGSLSSADLMAVLYFGGCMRHDPENPQWEDRDRFVLSKGHVAPVLYAALAESGYFPTEELLTLRKLGSRLQGHPVRGKVPGQDIVDLAAEGHEVIVAHGNGPQVGMIQKAMDELATNYTDNYMETPLPTCVAMSQGYIGIDLQNAIKYELHRRGMDVKVSTILSQVEVDKNDEAFRNPTKPIGRFLTEEEAKRNQENGIPCMEDAGRGYRVVVASPMPKKIRELLTIKTLVDAGHIVITCGGGGIPVVDEDGKLSGVNAVIDKDNASSLLAAELGADYLIILTAVEKVAINFGKENQEWLSDLTVDQAKEYIAQEQFAKGSMLPKIEAAIRFAESGEGRRTLITLLDKAAAGIAGETGTVIHK